MTKGKQCTKRSPSLARALKQARDAGKNVCRAQIHPDGQIDLTFGEPEPSTTNNPWDKAAEDLTKK